MPKFIFSEVIDSSDVITARVSAGTTSANAYTDAEVGKFVKLAAESRYALCAAGDPIQGRVSSIEVGTQDDHSIGGVVTKAKFFECIADGLEATPGTGAVVIGDYVVCGTVVAKGTALTNSRSAKVCKATNQPGATVVLADNLVATVNAGLVLLADAQMNGVFGWRVASLGSAGTGAVGTAIVIERVGM